MTKKTKYRELQPEELQAIQTFAAHYGRKWKDKLAFEYWFTARIFSKAGIEYPELQRLRNDLGPSWLAGFKLAM